MKKIFLCFVLILFLFSFQGTTNVVCAEEDLEQELGEVVEEQLSSFDFEKLDDVLDDLSEDSKGFFKSQSFWDKIHQMLSGNFGVGFSSFFQAFLNLFFKDVLAYLPVLALVVVVTLLSSLIGSLKGKVAENGVGQVVSFVSFSVVIVLISSLVISIFGSSKQLVLSMQTQMNVIFPILLSIVASLGGAVSVGIFQPSVAILTNVIVNIFVILILPMFVFLFVLIVVNNFSPSIKLNKAQKFVSSLFKWSSGLCFSVFLGILAINGIVAGSFDSVSIKAAKFAVKSYVPILGGYLSDGFNIVASGSVLIKNVVGVGGIMLLFASILTPVVQIIALSLMLKLTAAILEPFENLSSSSNFLYSVSKVLGLLAMLILGVAFMYVTTVGLILCTANVF